MEKVISPQYNPKETEPEIYRKWEESGFFDPDKLPQKDGKPYTIILPPPNVTGTLHMGHALMLTIEDIVIRFQRMRGKKTLWLPGTDHAAIATQSKVESIIHKEEKKTRHDLGREEFLKRVEGFAKQSHDTIVGQMKKMGASVDWSREAYTLDEPRNLAVRTAFKKMYDAGLIYKGKRIVNWDPKLQTTVSDDEVEWIEEKTPLYYLKYGPFVIATARPETKFGDKYVVIHPDDTRYKKYKDGEKLDVEWINGKVTATIVKDPIIDMEFGTGVMTITPSHDTTDFDIAERRALDFEQIIDENGKLLPIAGEFAGTHIKKARPLIVEKLKEKGLIEKIDETYTHRIATNSRGGGVIEPQIKEQWFVNVNAKFKMQNSKLQSVKNGDEVTLKELMRSVVESGEIKIIPERFEKIYYHWIDNLRDWCISRQIWYGHRIPVWYCIACRKPKINLKEKGNWFFVRHGETDWNTAKRIQGHTNDESPLNEAGKAQARAAAEQLKAYSVDLILSSDLLRAKETAEIIARGFHAELLFDSGLRERHFGIFEGTTKEERLEKNIEEIFLDFLNGKSDDPHEGENLRSFEHRVALEIEKHKKNHVHKNVVIVTHGGFIRLLTILLKRLENTLQSEISVKNASVIHLTLGESCDSCGNDFYEQDPDTLDTWFSSGLWTFSTLGWPAFAETATAGKPGPEHDLANFHPTDVLETGYDILFFWVARMILMSTYLLGEVPFRTVYLHGLVRDERKQKMSKSKGNIVDPLDLGTTYGTDALRFGLIFGTAPGTDIPLSEDKIRGMKYFANKLWNIARFVLTNVDSIDMNAPWKNLSPKTDADKDITKKLKNAVAGVTNGLETLAIHEAAQALYSFAWHEFADVYIEASKSQFADPALKENTQKILGASLVTILKLGHPFMPFITEKIWSLLPTKQKNLLLIEPWPNQKL